MMNLFTIATFFFITFLNVTPVISQTIVALSGFHGSTIPPNNQFGFVYPPATITVNVLDTIIVSWWTNATGDLAQFGYPDPVVGANIATNVPTIGTTAFVVPEFPSYPQTVSLDYVLSPSESTNSQYQVTVQVIVTSTSGKPTTYGASTTGMSVSLSSAASAPSSTQSPNSSSVSSGAAATQTQSTSISSVPTGAAATQKGLGMVGMVGAAALAAFL